MIKKSIIAIVGISLFWGCGSSSSKSNNNPNNEEISINVWDYFVPNESSSLSFDKIEMINSEVTSTELNAFTHSYNIISDTQATGNWRDYEGEYSYKIKHFNGEVTEVTFAPVEESPNYAYSSGGIRIYRNIGDFFYNSGGDFYFTTFDSSTISSTNIVGGRCVLNNIYNTKELYNGYSYRDVIELKCETTRNQKYGDINSPMTIRGVDRYYEYYQKGVGWIGKINKTCVVAKIDDYEFIDDNNATCIKTTTEYKLKNNY